MSTRLVMYSLSKHIRSSPSGLGFSFDFVLKELIGSNQGGALSRFLTRGRERRSRREVPPKWRLFQTTTTVSSGPRGNTQF